MLQKTSLEIVLTPQEAEDYYRTIHRTLELLSELPLATTATYKHVALRANLKRLGALLDDASPPLRLDDPFVPEGNGSAHDVLLGKLVQNQGQILGYLDHCSRGRPEDARRWSLAANELAVAWNEYEELTRG